MSQEQMIEYGKQKRSTSKIYKAQSLEITDEAISNTVRKGLAELVNADITNKINLSDIDMVKEVSIAYTRACADASCFPTMSGLARAMGCSRQALYHWMRKKDSETGEWLTLCHNLYSDVLAELSLRNNCNPVVSIFLQKAMFGLSETENVVLQMNQMPSDDDSYNDGSYDYKEKYRRNIIGDGE